MKNKRIVINWVLFLGWMALIFFMSNQPGAVSTKQSDLVVKIFMQIGIDLNDKMGSLATFIIRKTAHVSEYFVLGIITLNLFKNYFKGSLNKLYSLAFVILYASSDEIHQHFIPGRTMAFRDVMIDTAGGLIAIIVFIIIGKLKKHHKEIQSLRV